MLQACLLIAVFQLSFVETRTIRGKVTNEQGIPISGATVSVKGSITGTVTKDDGTYYIAIEPNHKVLVFSYIGHGIVEQRIGNSDVIDVVLPALEQDLQEVVVTAFSTRRSASFNALEGKVSGLYVGNAGKQKRGNRRGQQDKDFNTEEYDRITDNSFVKVDDDPLSTFSIDVDVASYSNVRRFLNNGQLPPADAVRTEEMVNYFKYDYPQPKGEIPFSIHTEITTCPWNENNKLVLVGLQGKQVPVDKLPPSNIVFLVDVSGSMDDPLKLPLVKSSLKMLTDQLREEDKISIVVYAGAAGEVLPATSGANKKMIRDAIDRLEAGGSTAGGQGLLLAYKTAKANFKKGGNNRIVLCTDGDFNVGVSSNGELERMVETERESGIFLTVLGYGMGNYKDSKMQIIADKGNGNHAYIDSESEAKKVLVNEFGGTLFTIAKDVKLQVEFNPLKVQGYRLIGYENRLLDKKDFNDDKKDAGELGSGHTVTALYEIIPVGVNSEFLKDVNELRYQKNSKVKKPALSDELLTINFRYKQPGANKSLLIVHPLMDSEIHFDSASENLRFAASVAEFGMLLRNSEYRASSSFDHVISTAGNAVSNDKEGYRKEFIELVKKAHELYKGAKVTKN